ncbi:Uncharacterised protein [Mycobacteroides abscessus subsp. abscessus]|uniref:hypothetical protein n=1 Tax=Mycobacteroides abscessus TaxID=36809 RepID=UPI000927B9D7|nr:hypothetical protein [Mycobacteroides abscessus]SHU93738.1 Uncharacterised protein [Mycobacteroides abscessus subsp. abscessus]SHX73437.1 Uncharacterised protein [Mycobacteroides abscessus subsp. abscessus]SIG86581.1 Uncharacterised protein [Mycobacteroides abscessus subsp. abscessus]SKD18810.1 Uncharacterised protein [Mycobacteroides abscessus subsp. abscessus]SKN09974.1 Uncharacterised protein [Mycobacteroides abscessus subsp. abscessus]
MAEPIDLNAAEYRLGGDDLDVKTATAMALIDIAHTLREIRDAMIAMPTTGGVRQRWGQR